jgi:hypothetical protein
VIDRVLIDTLKFKSKHLAGRWAAQIRKAPQLKHYNVLSDETLVAIGEAIFPQLAGFLEEGLNRSVLGAYFVKFGKGSVQHGFPLSESVYGLRLSQKVVLEYIESECIMDSSFTLYQTLSVIPKVADFFLLGCFYINKGFHEALFAQMNTADHVSEGLLKKYFKDDFFFKKEDQE